LPEIYFEETTYLERTITHGHGSPTLLCVHIGVFVRNHMLVPNKYMVVRGLIISLSLD